MSRFDDNPLRELLRLYASNYFSLLQLLPAEGECLYMRLGQTPATETTWRLDIVETTPYSQLLRVLQIEKPVELELLVRVYHDSHQAEVHSAQKVNRLRSYRSTDQGRMDERREWNIFLQDWLLLCKTQARTLTAEEVAVYEVG